MRGASCDPRTPSSQDAVALGSPPVSQRPTDNVEASRL